MYVIFSSHNGARTLPKMLRRLTELYEPECEWRVIAVDNGSSDETPVILKKFRHMLPLEVLRHERLGKNSALNAALEVADDSASEFVFTDDDVLPCRGWLRALRAASEDNPQYTIFGGSIAPYWMSPPPDWLLSLRGYFGVCYALTDPGLERGLVCAGKVWGPNMMIRGDALRQGFRFEEGRGPRAGTQYMMGSETELTKRMAAKGHRAFYEPAACVRHMIRPEQLDRKWLMGRAYRYGRSEAANVFDRLGRDGGGLPHWFGVPRHVYRALLAARVGAFLKGAPFGSRRSFNDEWRFHRGLGFMHEYRKQYKARN